MDFNIEETFEVFMAVSILSVAIVMVISAPPPNYLHHHINKDPTLLIPPRRAEVVQSKNSALRFFFEKDKIFCRAHTLFRCKGAHPCTSSSGQGGGKRVLEDLF